MSPQRPATAVVTARSDPAALLRVDAACRTLGLPTIRAEVGRIVELLLGSDSRNGPFLAEVLPADVDDRDLRRRLRMVREARFPCSKRLADFDHTALPDLPPHHVG